MLSMSHELTDAPLPIRTYSGNDAKESLGILLEDGWVKTLCMRIVYEVIERTIDKYGQILPAPDIELNTWWTNLGWSDDTAGGVLRSFLSEKAVFIRKFVSVTQSYHVSKNNVSCFTDSGSL